ncbi:MAG: hypothetical protein ACXW35_11915 [Nitrospira sp.]
MMQCDFCGAKAPVIKKAIKSFGRGDKLVVIEDIPTIRSAPTATGRMSWPRQLEKLDRIRKNRRTVGKAKQVLVASFKKSAA